MEFSANSIEFMWLFAPNINCKHGYSTRSGGVSEGPFNSLNFGSSNDRLENINQNKQIALAKLQIQDYELSTLKQVHGITVCEAKHGEQIGDALVSNKSKIVLAIGVADCYPLLFYDEKNKVIGAAHAGWRGTVGKIAEHTIMAMQKLNADVSEIKVAIGQGICQDKFEVGKEVIEQFEQAGFNNNCWKGNKIDLVKCNLEVLMKSGIKEKNIWAMNRCTFENDFFSYRRDAGNTGRMWAVIALD